MTVNTDGTIRMSTLMKTTVDPKQLWMKVKGSKLFISKAANAVLSVQEAGEFKIKDGLMKAQGSKGYVKVANDGTLQLSTSRIQKWKIVHATTRV